MLSERAAAYVRVSSQRQADEGVSIDAQIRRIKQYAQFKGLTLKDEDIFIDRAVSGGIPIWLRPQGGALHRKLLREGIPHLISMKIDRMFRIVSDALITVRNYSMTHILSFLTILAAMAEMERGLISERTKMGMDYLKRTHKRFTHSVYGWDTNEQGSIEPNWIEQGRIDYMRWMLNLGVTASSIAKSLNTQGVLGKKGGQWSGSGVLRTVRNEFHEQRKKYSEQEGWGSREWHEAVPWTVKF